MPRVTRAFTLSEVAIAMAIGSLLLAGLVTGYVMSAQRAEWSAYSLAAHSLAMQKVEQIRAAKWDPLAWPPEDDAVSANFPPTSEVLDIPISGTNVVYATNTVTIADVSLLPPLKLVRVDATWSFGTRGPFTNTIITYRAPDQ